MYDKNYHIRKKSCRECLTRTVWCAIICIVNVSICDRFTVIMCKAVPFPEHRQPVRYFNIIQQDMT